MLLEGKVVEYIGAPFRKGAAFSERCSFQDKVVEYIVEVLLEGKGLLSGKVVEYIVEVLLEGKVVEYIGAAFQERWSSI